MDKLYLQAYFRGMPLDRLQVLRACYQRLAAKHNTEHWRSSLEAIEDLISDMQARPIKQLSIFEQ